MAIVLLVGGSAGGVGAQEAGCANPQSQRELSRCAQHEADRLDSLLVALEAEIADRLDPDAVSAFDSLQTSWREFRRRDCRFEGMRYGEGSMRPLILSACLAAETAERIRRLGVWLCEGAGATGECAASRRYTDAIDEGGGGADR